jgi:hypothetical protein
MMPTAAKDTWSSPSLLSRSLVFSPPEDGFVSQRSGGAAKRELILGSMHLMQKRIIMAVGTQRRKPKMPLLPKFR